MESVFVLLGKSKDPPIPMQVLFGVFMGLRRSEINEANQAIAKDVVTKKKTLTMEQILVLLEKSRDTPIYMQVLFGVFMGLRRSEINGVK